MNGEDRLTWRDLQRSMDRVEGKVDAMIGRMDARVTRLENFQNRALGIISVFTAFTSLVATYIWDKIAKGS